MIGRTKHSIKKQAGWLAGLLLPAALVLSGCGAGDRSSSDQQSVVVERGDLLISVVEGGSLEAFREVTISSDVEGQVQILSIVSEGTYVNEGDLLVQLDSSSIEDRLTQQEISYQNALSVFNTARETLEVRESEAVSSVRDAKVKYEFARMDLQKYLDGEWPQQRMNAESAITLAEEELQRAGDRLEWTRELQEQGYATRSELEADRLNQRRRELDLQKAEEERRILIDFAHPRKLMELETAVTQAEERLENERRLANIQVEQARSNLAARRAQLELEQERVERIRDQLAKTRITAPQDGLVVYAQHRNFLVEEGAMVRQRQELIKLPNLSRLMIEVKVHESMISMIRRGQPAIVSVDSMPDRRFRGVVHRVAPLPDPQQRWLNPNLKVYTTHVLLEDEIPDINPGVSGRAEIIVANLEDVVNVPVQAVSSLGDRRVVYRQLPNQRVEAAAVQVGLHNNRSIQIVEGLEPGDRILLSPPTGDFALNLGGRVIPPSEVPAYLAQFNRSRETNGVNPEADMNEPDAPEASGEGGREGRGAGGGRRGGGERAGGGGGNRRGGEAVDTRAATP